MTARKWGKYHDDFLIKYYTTHGRQFCANRLGFSTTTISLYAAQLKLKDPPPSAWLVDQANASAEFRKFTIVPEKPWPSITRCSRKRKTA